MSNADSQYQESCTTGLGPAASDISSYTLAGGLCSACRSCAPLTLGHDACAGFSARQRKQELERLNEQLRKINLNLRQQARAGTVYAPGLTYAPTPMPDISFGDREGGLQGPAATWAVPAARPEAPEDAQVGLPPISLISRKTPHAPDTFDIRLGGRQCTFVVGRTAWQCHAQLDDMCNSISGLPLEVGRQADVRRVAHHELLSA